MSDQWMIEQNQDGSWQAMLRGSPQASFQTSAAALDYVKMMKGIRQLEPEAQPAEAKIKRIKLFYSSTTDYYATEVTNSMEYDPGQTFTRSQVASLCEDPAWEVTIVGL